MVFRKLALKCRCGGSRPQFLVCPSFFIESLSRKIFEVGDPKNRRFWAFFQKSMSEISANWEKTCFLCCRFFRKIEEMRVYFGGCALIFFSKIWTNVQRPVCKNQGDRRGTRKVIEHPMSVFFWGEHGTTLGRTFEPKPNTLGFYFQSRPTATCLRFTKQF